MLSRRRRLGELPQQEQGEASADDVHGRAAAGASSELPAGLKPRRTGLGANSADHRTQQASDPGVVPEQ